MRILLADDQELVRETLAAFLRQSEDVSVEVANDLAGAIEAVKKSPKYDIVLLDYMMPGMNGLSGLATMKSAVGEAPVAILSGSAPNLVAQQAIAAGAAGFLPKTMSTRSLMAALRFMAAGEVYSPVNLRPESEELPPGLANANLTQREVDVLKRLCQGMANKEIARELDIQEVTVKLHVKTLYRKIGAKNRTHAAMLAREAGLA